MVKHFNITIQGRVQGVGFRWGARSMARELGIFGYVKNMNDGSVYIEAEGEEVKLEKFVAWCRTGPLWGNVKDFHIQESELKNFSEFLIK